MILHQTEQNNNIGLASQINQRNKAASISLTLNDDRYTFKKMLLSKIYVASAIVFILVVLNYHSSHHFIRNETFGRKLSNSHQQAHMRKSLKLETKFLGVENQKKKPRKILRATSAKKFQSLC